MVYANIINTKFRVWGSVRAMNGKQWPQNLPPVHKMFSFRDKSMQEDCNLLWNDGRKVRQEGYPTSAAYTTNTVDREIFVMEKFSSITFNAKN